MSTIKIATDFSKNPGARYYGDGDFSGEEFFDKLLDVEFASSLQKKEKLIVDLDGTTGYASSFLSEAFGRLGEKYSATTVLNNLDIISNEEPDWKAAIINDYLPNASKRKKRGAK